MAKDSYVKAVRALQECEDVVKRLRQNLSERNEEVKQLREASAEPQAPSAWSFQTLSDAFGHPVTPTLLGAAVTIAGAVGFAIRCLAVMVLTVWAIVDIFPYGRKRQWHPAATIGLAVALGASCLCAIGYMRSTQLREVWRQMHIDVSIPINGDAKDSIFTARNGSDATVGRHEITCDLVFVKTDVTLKGNPPKDENSAHGFYATRYPFTSTLPPDQGHSTQCLLVFEKHPIQCADVVLSISYGLDAWPRAIWRTSRKRARFYGQRTNGRFGWEEEPVDSQVSFCEQPMQP